jgi:hypothetical protein
MIAEKDKGLIRLKKKFFIFKNTLDLLPDVGPIL